MRRCTASIFAAILLTSTVRALAGPDHIEQNDAGSTIGGAQKIFKNNVVLERIYGSLGSVRSSGRGLDIEDMYQFRIVDPINFSARTDGVDGSFAEFDSELWLFRIDGNNAFGLLGNDDVHPTCQPGFVCGGSLIRPPATDDTGQMIPGPGDYLLAISRKNSKPLSAGGLIFNQADPTEISGPDGPGGPFPHQAWTGSDHPGGNYLIVLTGAEGYPLVPATSTWGMMALALGIAAVGSAVVVLRRPAGHRA